MQTTHFTNDHHYNKLHMQQTNQSVNACQNKRKRADRSARLISFPLITLHTNLNCDLNGSADERSREALKLRPPLRHRGKVMPYHIWHPKAWEIDPPVWSLIGSGFEHALGPSMEERVRSETCARLSSFVTGIDARSQWGRLTQSGHVRRTAWVYVTLCLYTCLSAVW